MKKNKLSNYFVKRISSSPYFSSDFLKLEKEAIDNITQAEMLAFSSTEFADIIITNTHTKINQLSKSELSQCKLMIHPNSGYDNFSAEFVKSATFPIVIGNPIRANAVTNYILAALFNHYSPLLQEVTWDITRKWPRKLLSELNILILGAGHIGLLLEKSLGALVGKLQLHDPYKKNASLDLKKTDVVILACSLNKENYHLVNFNFLENLNNDFLLINAARGQLVNTKDLKTILKAKPEAFAVLDVFEQEPFDFNEFEDLKNVTLTSHIAGVFKNIDHVTVAFEQQVVFDFINLTNEDFENRYHNILLKNKTMNDYLI